MFLTKQNTNFSDILPRDVILIKDVRIILIMSMFNYMDFFDVHRSKYQHESIIHKIWVVDNIKKAL